MGRSDDGSARKIISPLNEAAVQSELNAEETRQAELPSRSGLTNETVDVQLSAEEFDTLVISGSRKKTPTLLLVLGGIVLLFCVAAITIFVLSKLLAA